MIDYFRQEKVALITVDTGWDRHGWDSNAGRMCDQLG